MLLYEFLKKVDHTLLDLCWCQWRRLGAHADGPINICSTDAEALLLFTCAIGQKDGRLLEIAQQWLSRYQSLILVERLQRLFSRTRMQEPPFSHELVLKELIEKSLSPEEKLRWETLLSLVDQNNKGQRVDISLPQVVSQKKIEDHEAIVRKNLQLTLRQMFGPVAKADVLYLMHLILGEAADSFHVPINAPLLAKKLCFDRSSIHRVLTSLEKTHIVEKRSSSLTKKDDGNPGYSRGANWFLDALITTPEKAYVDWFEIAALVVHWCSFEKELLKNNVTAENMTPLFKVKLHTELGNFAQMAQSAYISLPRLPFSNRAIEKISVDEMMQGILFILEGVYQFVITPYTNTVAG